jgi:hypothetical protein
VLDETNMASATQKQAKKLASCVRLLLSDNPSEVAAALKGVERTLRSVVNTPADIHALADHIEGNNDGGLNHEEVKKVYDAGYNNGKRDAENKANFVSEQSFRNIDGSHNWLEIAKYCQRNNDRIKSPREVEFIDSVTSQLVWREPSERQEKWLLSIFYKLGGKLRP